MDNQELLTQVTDLFKQHNEVISERFDKLENRFDHLETEVKQIRLEMEVNVAKRIKRLWFHVVSQFSREQFVTQT